MADTKIEDLTDGVTADATDRFPATRDPTGTPTNVYVSPAYIKDYILGLANTWASGQTFVAPVLGTPASGDLSNCTGLPVGSVTGLGSGVATWLATPTLANLNTAVSDADLASLADNTFTRLQTITQGTANEGVLASTGYSLTGSSAVSLIDLAGTWNTSGTPTAIKLRVTDTASNAASLLLDLGTAAAGSVISVSKSGVLTIPQYPGRLDFGTQFSINGFSSGITLGVPAGADYFRIDSAKFGFVSTAYLGWGGDPNAPDTRIFRDAADVVAQRNSTNAQTFRVYETYTDSSNYERASLSCASNTATLAAETAGTGSDDMDVALTPAGAGLVKFGTHSAIAAETVTGYITIKDAAGNSRKVAVVS